MKVRAQKSNSKEIKPVVKLELKAVTVIPIVRALLMLEPRNRSSVTNRFHQLWIHQQTTAYDPSTVDW